jgi:hypothetical protein
VTRVPESFELTLEYIGRIDLDIDKITPGFGVSSEFLHKNCITILAGVPTADVGIDSIVDTGNTRFGEYRSTLYFVNDHR